MSGVLVVLEQNPGGLHKMALEALAAGQQFGSELGLPVFAAVLGSGVEPVAQTIAGYKLDKVHALDHELLKDYTPDGYTSALRQLIEAHQPAYVVFPHTYQVRDFAPKLATALGRVLVSDVIGHRVENGSLVAIRQLFQGKMNADVRLEGPGPHFISVQAGAFRADKLEAGSAPVEKTNPQLNPEQIRTKPLELFRESARAVDLGAAEIIVSVGRGIREAENIGIVEKLAEALGAELAASRPICDNGWLPMERQVGSSGQTVAPKMYIAVGISGAIQHLVGMKGAKTIVAINKDPEAPIFEVADYGIVGDLFQVVPALVDALKK
ncbi:MAG: electron transfer flavoprotein alpha subunit [Bryobacterales bacterium]|jgi:electron transfer flavoprotein alpha subunit|nr:electron transfer flavoprotein alpha subunit [Bryobacterales bacterium]